MLTPDISAAIKTEILFEPSTIINSQYFVQIPRIFGILQNKLGFTENTNRFTDMDQHV